MLNKRGVFLMVWIVSVGFFACQQKTYLGEVYTNYPDLNKILTDTWDQEVPYNYLKVTLSATKKDSVMLRSNEMPWEEINVLFQKANFHDEKLDKHYTIDVFVDDSISQTNTMFFESLEPEDFTQSLNIVSGIESSVLNNLYFTTGAAEFLNAKSVKVLYIPKELLQIQKDGAEGIVVDTYYFPK